MKMFNGRAVRVMEGAARGSLHDDNSTRGTAKIDKITNSSGVDGGRPIGGLDRREPLGSLVKRRVQLDPRSDAFHGNRC